MMELRDALVEEDVLPPREQQDGNRASVEGLGHPHRIPERVVDVGVFDP